MMISTMLLGTIPTCSAVAVPSLEKKLLVSYIYLCENAGLTYDGALAPLAVLDAVPIETTVTRAVNVLVRWHITIGMIAQSVLDAFEKQGNIAPNDPSLLSELSLAQIKMLLESRSVELYAESLSMDGTWQQLDEATQKQLVSFLDINYERKIPLTINYDSYNNVMRYLFEVPLLPETGEYTWQVLIIDDPDNRQYLIRWGAMMVKGDTYQDDTFAFDWGNPTYLLGPYVLSYSLVKAIGGKEAQIAYAASIPPQGTTMAQSSFSPVALPVGGRVGSGGSAYWGGMQNNQNGNYHGTWVLPSSTMQVSMDFENILSAV
jgi:hypothetical protein